MKLLVTGAWGYTADDLDKIRALGHEIVEMPDERGDLPCDDFEGVICNSLFLIYPIERFKRLRYIQLTSAGVDRVPTDYIAANGITLYNARGVYSVPMAEYAVSNVLDIYKDSSGFFEKQAKRIWEKNRDLRELFGKTVCVVGCGSVGTECAVRFKAFGCDVIGVDNAVSDWFDGIVSLERGFETADVVVLTLPLTAETKGIINEDTIGLLRSGAVLINISRGAIITRDALLCREDVYFALDVFEEEPLPATDVLWEKDNIIITPHNSFIGEGNIRRLSALIIGNLEKMAL